MAKDNTVVVIGDNERGRKKTLLIAVGVIALVFLLALLFYRPTSVVYLVITIYNPGNQSTANPHVQPITMSCAFLQELWKKVHGYLPTCQDIAGNVTFIEYGQVLPAYPIVSGNSITWWVRMPAIPAGASVNVTMILGNSSSITSPQNVFLVYGSITTLQPGYIYVLDTLNGVTTIYNPSGIGPFIYVANDSVWVFTPNTNPTYNGFTATPIGNGYLSIAATPSGQYFIGAALDFYAPFNVAYQPINLTGTYAIEYTPQSVLDALAGLGAAYVTPLVNPPPLSGYTAPQVRTNPYYIQLPQCNITSNPYTGINGTFGLLNCLAIKYNGTWAVIRFYYQPGVEGAILGFSNAQYPSGCSAYTPWVYVGTNGSLYFGDWVGSLFQVSFPLTPGWHTLIGGEYYSDGTYYVYACLDTVFNCKVTSTTNLPQLFSAYGNYPYSDVGTGDSVGAWPNTNQNWFFFDGYVQYIAIYSGGSSEGSYLIGKGVFNIASQTYNYAFGYAIDYPPNGVEPIIVSIHVNVPGWAPTQPVGTASYSVHVINS